MTAADDEIVELIKRLTANDQNAVTVYASNADPRMPKQVIAYGLHHSPWIVEGESLLDCLRKAVAEQRP